jgi:hypothetical protein
MSSIKKKSIPRVAPKAYEYTKQVLDFGFRNAHYVGITGELEKSLTKNSASDTVSLTATGQLSDICKRMYLWFHL